MLTPEEKDIVIQRLEEYPAQIPTYCWGYGPMAASGCPLPEETDEEILREYG